VKPGNYLGRKPLTPGRKVRFRHGALDAEPARMAEYAQAMPVSADESGASESFSLLSRRRRLGHNSWLHGAVRDGEEEARAWLHPQDLAALSLEPGDRVLIAATEAEITLPAHPQAGVMRGTIVVPHGLSGPNVNVLIPSGPDRVEPVSGNHHMTGIPVTVSPVSPTKRPKPLA
jgi:anaerobic selenocysteine-containing dehydrogenase